MGKMRSILRIDLKPVDVLRFRTPKPFKLGGYAETELLPPPVTIASAILYQLHLTMGVEGADFEEIVRNLKGRLVLHGPLLVDRGEVLAPCPLDLFRCPKCLYDGNSAVFLARAWELTEGQLSTPLPVHDPCHLKGEKLRGYLMPVRRIRERGNVKSTGELRKVGDICRRELRPGAHLDEERKAVRPGYFYAVEWVKLERDYSIRLYMEADAQLLGAIEQIKMVSLGGGGRPVEVSVSGRGLTIKDYCRELTGEELSVIAERIASDRAFDLILLTPGILVEGSVCTWKPDLDIPSALKGIGIDKPVKVSGWDLKLGAPKSLYTAIPPGSIYRFTLSEELGAEDVARKIVEPLLGNIGHWNTLGYGTALVLPQALSTESLGER